MVGIVRGVMVAALLWAALAPWLIFRDPRVAATATSVALFGAAWLMARWSIQAENAR